jgi:small subunit ribosomal protein S17
VLTPKQRRKQARSRASGPPGPPRPVEDRVRERATMRSRKAAERARWRARRREKEKGGDSEQRAGGVRDGVAEAREPGKRKVRQGVVVSNKGEKTITVRIDRMGRHRVYGKVVRATGTLHAHDERNEAQEGDVVRVMECRPLSRTKRWRLVEVLEKAR